MIPMVPSVFGSLAVGAYVAAAVVMYRSLKIAYVPGSPLMRSSRIQTLFLAWAAVALHAGAMAQWFAGNGGIDFSFLSALSAVTWIVVAIVLIAALIRPLDKLGIVVFPLAACMLLLKLGVPEGAHLIRSPGIPMTTHILSSMLAYSFLNIAAIQAILLALQDFGLRHHQAKGPLISSLPPLQTMENLLFQLIGAGFALLTVSLISGFAFLENMFAQHLAHKTVLSILAWLVFAVLLLGRARYGWRGQTAIRWTLGGFVSLMLAYFGSKMVLELILGRA